MDVTRKWKRALSSFMSGNYNLLLIFLFWLFILRPGQESAIWDGIWKIFLIGTILFAVFNAKHPYSVRIIASILAVPAILFSWIDVFQQSQIIVAGIAICSALFLGVCALSILRDVILRACVTLETLRGAVCVYFLMAFFFAYIYLFLENIAPGTMLIRGQIIPIFPHLLTFFSQMLYFSFITLLTIGFGDVVPAREVGQTFTVIEGIVGQFYLAILVARLVSVYAFFSDKRLLSRFEKKIRS